MSATAKLGRHDRGSRDGIAITGMACLFPSAPDLDAYWRNILDKYDAISDPPPEAWDPDVYYDPEFRDPDRTYCRRGGYLGALAEFEPLAHGIPPVAVGGEPDQWLALQVAHDALADAGALALSAEVRERTEIILGKGTYLNGGNALAIQRGLVVGQTIDLLRRLHPEHSESDLAALREELKSSLPDLGPETVPGVIPNIIVGRIANRLDLMGPAYTVDAACASSLVAIQHAVRDLRAGECDLALAGGAQVWMPVATLNLFCRLGALSRRQQLRAFDQDADGTLLGEGIGIVVLKRLAEAERDGDRVYAVIRGVGVASDGRGAGVMAPRVEGETLALRRAYDDAGVSPRSVALIEAHGTGTPVGDVVEVQALTSVFGHRVQGELPHCALGTVKSMISHTIPAAGVAGLIKTALALHHRVLPPTLNCEQPNPKLELERSPFYVNTETRPWIHGGAEPRRAGINAFGFGGINAHAVLEEFAPAGEPRLRRLPRATELCVLTGASAGELTEQAEELAGVLERGPDITLADLATALAGDCGDPGDSSAGGVGRHLAVVASSLDDLRQKLGQAIEKLRDPGCRRIKTVGGIYYEAEPLGAEAKVALVFPGEGAQYPNMLTDLCLHFDEAREVFDRTDRLYADHPRGHLLSDWVFPRPAFSDDERRRTDERLMELDIAVESVLTANAAVYAVVRRLLPRVNALVGHSTGEHSAAMAAGALDLASDADLATFCHGLYGSYDDAAARHDVPGAVLLAVGAGAEETSEIAALAGGELYLAMDNCPHQAVLVGDAAAVSRARTIATDRGLMCEQLPYDRAVHTPLFAPFAEDLGTVFARLPVRTGSPGLWSCTTARPYPKDPEAIRTLLVEHWTSPVRFRETIAALHDDGVRIFVEAGPRGNLTSFIDDILRGRTFCAVAADNRRRAGITQLNHLAGMLSAQGAAVDLGCLYESTPEERIDWRVASRRTDAPTAIPLSMSWPMLRISEEGVRRWHTAAEAPAPITLREPVSAPVAATNGHAATSGHVASNAYATVALAPQVKVEHEAERILAGHQQTMSRFLDTDAELMRAFLSGAAPVLLEQVRRPLVGAIVGCQPEVTLTARRVLDPGDDLYLRDHALGRGVSRTDPELAAMIVMPLAMTIEILAEAACCLLPQRVLIGLREVRAHRWLSVAEAPVTIELRADRLPAAGGAERVRVRLFEPAVSGDAPVAEAVILLGDGYPAPPEARMGELADPRPSRMATAELVYEEAMFHGPRWQGVEAVEAIGPAGARARLLVLERGDLLRDEPRPEFALDPVVLDAAGQLIGVWAAEVLERGQVVFPFRVAALDLFGPPLTPGSRLRCQAAIELLGDRLVRSDIDVALPGGALAMRVTGWEDRRFDAPERFGALRRPSGLEALSEPWEAGSARHPGHSVSCRRLCAELGDDGALWRQVWAGRVLSRREREQFAKLTLPEPRKLEWLAARTAAKEAVAELVWGAAGAELRAAEIEIVADERGMPVLAAPPLAGWRALISLTHSDGTAAALVVLVPDGDPRFVAVGIDLEPLVSRPPGFSDAALRDSERRLLETLPPAGRAEWELRCWCAKEAAGKAAGTGVAAGPGGPRVDGLDPARERVLIEVSGRLIGVETQLVDGWVLATTLGEDTTG